MVDFTDPRTMALLGFGSALMQQSGASPRPVSLSEGVGGAFQSGLQGAQAAYGFQGQEMLRKKMHDEALQRIEAQEFLKQHQSQGTDPRTLIQQASLSGNPVLMTMASNISKLQPTVKTTEKVKGPDGKVYTRPIFTDGSRGDISDMEVAAPLQFQSTGKQLLGLDAYTGMPQTQYEQTTSPYQDQQLAQSARHHADSMGMQRANLGLQQQNADFNRQMQMLGIDPEFQAMKAGMIAKARSGGTIQAQAESNLPGAITQATQSIQVAEDLLNHPGFDNSVGMKSPYGAVKSFIPGTDEADWKSRFEQVDAKKFLGGIEYMRGFGQLTEKEGTAAANAYSRMNRATSQKEFIAAAREFQQSMQQGVDKIAAQAGVQSPKIEPVNNFAKPGANDDHLWGQVTTR